MVNIMENPKKKGMIWGENPLFSETSISEPNPKGFQKPVLYQPGNPAPNLQVGRFNGTAPWLSRKNMEKTGVFNGSI